MVYIIWAWCVSSAPLTKTPLTMKSAITLFLVFIASAGLQAQTDLRKLTVKHRLQGELPITLSTSDETITLENYIYNDFGDDYLIENTAESQNEIEFSIVKRENQISGYIYYPGKENGYVIEMHDGEVAYKKTPASEIFVTCSFTAEEEAFNAQEVAQEQVYPDTYFIGNYSTVTDVLDLQSRPGAQYVIYLDFDGEPTLKGWESQGFVATAVTNIPVGMKQRIWEAVAADFIPFDVNITTNRALFDAHSTVYKGWAVLADFGSPGWYGVAFRPSFGTGKPALIDLPTSWNGNLNYLYRTPSHELGHSLSLSHDGNNLNGDGEYYKGHGEYTPIMGSGNRLVTHWSKGEYSGATNTENDLSMLHGYLGYSSDDFTGTREITFSGENISAEDNHGVIDNNSDEDIWRFEMTGTGDVKITVDPVLVLTDLDVHLVLKNEFGQVVFEDNPVGKREVVIDQALDLGTYYLHISAGSELTTNSGWSTYGVYGYYDIYGSVENVVRENHDIIAVRLDGLDNICSSTEVITPTVSVQNGGMEFIYSLQFQVFEDDVLVHSETKSVNIATDDVQVFTLPVITSEGNHTYKVVVSDPNGIETKTDNNSLTGSFNYTLGDMYEFFTDMPYYNGVSGFVWNSTSTTGSTSLPSSSLVTINSSGGTVTQEFCLSANNCYNFNFTGDIDGCVGGNRWNANTVYNNGDQCLYGGIIWKAKWWTQGEEPPSDVWEQVGTCSAGNYEFGVTDLSKEEELFVIQTANYTSPQSEEICMGEITGVFDQASQNNTLLVYPNPTASQLNIVSDVAGEVSVFNAQGVLMYSSFILNHLEFQTEQWSSGIYFVVFTNGRERKVQKVIK